jgi:hypothetical protein
MRVSKCVLALSAAALLAIPVTAAIKAMNLRELMEITQDAVHGKITARDSFRLDHPWEGALYTRLTIEGESLRTGEKGTFQVVFHGSHEKSDWYGISTMPTIQDSRLGGETIVFFGEHPMLPGQNLVSSFASTYRVESGFGQPVVVGKGEGMAFPENTKLVDAATDIRAMHAELSVGQKSPGLGK